MSRYYYRQEISHEGLMKTKVIAGETKAHLQYKISMQQAQWDEQWSKKVKQEKQRIDRETAKRNTELAINYAAELTSEAETAFNNLSALLTYRNVELNKNSFYDDSTFNSPKPIMPKKLDYMPAPERNDPKYNTKPPLKSLFSKNLRIDHNEKNEALFISDMAEWNLQKKIIDSKNKEQEQYYNNVTYKEWKKSRDKFISNQNDFNKSVDVMFKNFCNEDKDTVEQYFSLLFDTITLPLTYENEVVVEYIPDNNTLVVDVNLPELDNLPNIKKVTYVKSTNTYKETYHSEASLKKIYDKVIYDIVLLYLSVIFKQSINNSVNSVVLNGKLRTIDKATGNNIEPYILSVTVSKNDFLLLNVDLIDSKVWFKSSKGVSATTLSKVTPVAPIVQINREDKRFVEGYEVISSIDKSINLAAIDWQDFENLIREVFAKEFKSSGGDVKVTQASRDGGVDAIAFDPDPIRGGKIVIQAKRYTNVVGVSAVRDLYGTVMNEGATKGILVTTSNFGNDAYEFANGKPITLINGANLLFLMEKHGHSARIDLAEAKMILKDSEK